MKILYAGSISANDSALYRLWALERLGHRVVRLNALDYVPVNRWMARLVHRAVAGPQVARVNRDLLRLAKEERPDVFWADKMLWLWPRTVEAMRSMGIATVSYMIDNAFGERGDPGWRLYRKTIPRFDLHVVQRDRNVAEYSERGARDVMKIQTAYEPTLQYPPPPGWTDADRDREVSFIGSPYDDRAEFLTRLWREFEVAVRVSGNAVWGRMLKGQAAAAIYPRAGELYGDAYRGGIWRSKINLSFLTHGNLDEFAHKSFEIAGCGGFLLAERSAGHLERFVEDEEAVFFSSIEECVGKIRRYLPDEAARTRIGAAGRKRAASDGYHNDRQVGLIVDRLQPVVAARRVSWDGDKD